MSGVALAVGGSALVGGIISSDMQRRSADKAANASQYGTDQATALQRYMYDTSRNDMMPYMNVGVQSLYDAFGYAPTTQTYYPSGTSPGGSAQSDVFRSLLGGGIAQQAPVATQPQTSLGGKINALESNRASLL